jgi:predicted DNA-binding ribbon-helix-helix protein
MSEFWREIPGFSYYEVSTLGRVRSKGKPYHPARILKPGKTKRGYLLVSLREMGKPHTKTVHRLVLEAFVGLCPLRHECGHRNGVRTDNRLENLRWVTAKENAADRKKHGTHQVGETSSGAKLTEDIVQEIRASTCNQRELAARLGVHQSTISNIRAQRTWRHVPKPVDSNGILIPWEPRIEEKKAT